MDMISESIFGKKSSKSDDPFEYAIHWMDDNYSACELLYDDTIVFDMSVIESEYYNLFPSLEIDEEDEDIYSSLENDDNESGEDFPIELSPINNL